VKGEDIRKWYRKVNMVEIPCTHVCKWKNGTWWNYSKCGGEIKRMVEGMNLRNIVRTFVNVKIYPQYNNNMIIKMKFNEKNALSGILAINCHTFHSTHQIVHNLWLHILCPCSKFYFPSVARSLSIIITFEKCSLRFILTFYYLFTNLCLKTLNF
jgi:hypothetical protein